MSRLVYSLVFYLLTPLVLLRLWYRSLRAPDYGKRWAERFGLFKLPETFAKDKKPVWVHAVSVGETLAAVPLIRLLQSHHPDRQIVVTTMTPTGSERVKALFGESVFHVYLPYDLPGAMARFVGKVDPALLIIMETELWPNLLNQCKKAGCRTMLVNARLSEKSAAGYRRLRSLSRWMLDRLDVIAAQATPDAERFVQLGAPADRVKVVGSLKFEMEPPSQQQQPPAVFSQLARLDRPVLVAASTREGEEEKVLAAFKRCLEQVPELLLVLVPRHPERFNGVARLCEERGFRTVRRSSNESPADDTQVFLGDSMGEMWNYYAVADLAFVGGSLVDTGCHNVLEPAALGIPVLIGPSRFNFETICNLLQEAGALLAVADENDLAQQLLQLLGNQPWRQAMGEAGKQLVEANRGCLQRISRLVDEQLAARQTDSQAATGR